MYIYIYRNIYIYIYIRFFDKTEVLFFYFLTRDIETDIETGYITGDLKLSVAYIMA